MSENLRYWNAMKRPPATALRGIGAGRLKGKSDISPQWRLEVMTETFGPIGYGWAYRIVKQWLEQGHGNEIAAFTEIELRVCVSGEWSQPIPGVGGSMLVAQEKNGPYTSDEAYKMSLTDALSVAMKQLGVAADIYAGLWDGSKYIERAPDRSASKALSKTLPPPDGSAVRAKFDEQLDELLKAMAIDDQTKVYEIWGSLNDAEKMKAKADSLLSNNQLRRVRAIVVKLVAADEDKPAPPWALKVLEETASEIKS